jgi:uroporphyrinogen decarboxylase
MNRFNQAIRRRNPGRPPVWFMRQAGRYHSHYQALKRDHDFMALCKDPVLACEVTMGPIRDFDFDAAILFSDLLFPLEVMGMGLRYAPGPELGWHLKTLADLNRLQGGAERAAGLEFQADALRRIRTALPEDKGLLGFVGGPLTLFFYAVAGSHKGDVSDAVAGVEDGRFAGFCDRLMELLAANILLQFRAGADTVAVMDTAAGEIPLASFQRHVVPRLTQLFAEVRALIPTAQFTYYSRRIGPAHWHALKDLPISCLGVDWEHPLSAVMAEVGDRWAVQGNFDPHQMLLPEAELRPLLHRFFADPQTVSPERRAGWVCGLGHGVLPGTPEANVRLFLELHRDHFPA